MGGMHLIFIPVLVRCFLGPLGLSGHSTSWTHRHQVHWNTRNIYWYNRYTGTVGTLVHQVRIHMYTGTCTLGSYTSTLSTLLHQVKWYTKYISTLGKVHWYRLYNVTLNTPEHYTRYTGTLGSYPGILYIQVQQYTIYVHQYSWNTGNLGTLVHLVLSKQS